MNLRSNPGLRAAAILLGSWLLAGCATMDDAGTSPVADLKESSVLHLAAAAQKSGDLPMAVRLFKRAVNADPKNAGLHVALGQALLAAGAQQDAAGEFRRASALAPERADAHMFLGRMFLAGHKPNQALAEFEAVLNKDPREVGALNGKGIALDLLGRGHEAQEAYRAALAVSPDDHAVRNNLGLSLALSGSYDAAIDELSKLVLEPGATSRNRQNLSLALGLKGERDKAARVARADLDEAATKENLAFFDAVRELVSPPANAGPASDTHAGTEPGLADGPALKVE